LKVAQPHPFASWQKTPRNEIPQKVSLISLLLCKEALCVGYAKSRFANLTQRDFLQMFPKTNLSIILSLCPGNHEGHMVSNFYV